MPLRTLAVDFNSYFASCEQQERPELRGRPIGIVPVLADTTCCIAASYAAKQRGVKVGTSIPEARALCPDIVLVQQRPSLYIDYHRRLLAEIEACVHVTTIKSIDEMECDLTATFAPREKALAVARQIKERIARNVGPCLTCSIGLAPNWLLAKLATDMDKPDGLVVLDDADLPQKLLHLAPADICGIGPRMDHRLRAHGIDSVEKLYAATKAELRGIWGGVEGERMHARLRGDLVPLPPSVPRTVGHSHVLAPVRRNDAMARAVLHRMLQKAAMRLRALAHYAGGLSVFVGCSDRSTWEDDIRLTETQDTHALTRALAQVLARRTAPFRSPVKVGVLLHRLLPMSAHTPELFDREQAAAHERLDEALDTLNRTYGHGTVFLGGAFGVTKDAPMRIAFTRIPTPELEEIDPSKNRRVR